MCNKVYEMPNVAYTEILPGVAGFKMAAYLERLTDLHFVDCCF